MSTSPRVTRRGLFGLLGALSATLVIAAPSQPHDVGIGGTGVGAKLLFPDHRLPAGRFVFTPYASFYHYESVSRPQAAEELATFNAKWAGVVGSPPYYNPNLSQNSNRFEIGSHAPDLASSSEA